MKRRRAEKPMTAADEAFFAGFKSTMTDDDHRRNRDSSIRGAINEIEGVLGALSQTRSIREPNIRDAEIAISLERIVRELKEQKP